MGDTHLPSRGQVPAGARLGFLLGAARRAAGPHTVCPAPLALSAHGWHRALCVLQAGSVTPSLFGTGGRMFADALVALLFERGWAHHLERLPGVRTRPTRTAALLPLCTECTADGAHCVCGPPLTARTVRGAGDGAAIPWQGARGASDLRPISAFALLIQGCHASLTWQLDTGRADTFLIWQFTSSSRGGPRVPSPRGKRRSAVRACTPP